MAKRQWSAVDHNVRVLHADSGQQALKKYSADFVYWDDSQSILLNEWNKVQIFITKNLQTQLQ